MPEQRNFIVAIALSVVIIVGFDFFYMKPIRDQVEQPVEQQAGEMAETPMPSTTVTDSTATAPGADSLAPGSVAADVVARDAALAATPRILINSPRLRGSISLEAGRIDDLVLTDYRETIDPDSPQITLLSPRGSQNAYYAEFGWVGADGSTPGRDAIWQADYGELTPDQPVTLTWDDGDGLSFIRRISLDENFMFTIEQTVTNNGTLPVEMSPFSLISRTGTPPTLGFYILHEGLLGVFDGTLKEIDYSDIQDDGMVEVTSGEGGWIGITDKYWLAALVPDQNAAIDGRFLHTLSDNVDRYQADVLRGAQRIAPGDSITVVDRIFAGAKEVNLLDRYADKYGIVNFDLAIDFGWFYFLTRPIFWLIDKFNSWLGNFGLAILLLTVLIKAAFFPLANKSYVAMSKMKKLQPKMTELREQYGDDKAGMQRALMSMYKEEKVNPASGCLPIVVQIPVFFSLYKVLFVSIEMRHAPFYGWIHDLSARDPTSLLNLFGLIPWTPPPFLDFLNIGVWAIVMGLTMFMQQRLNPQPADPMQAKIMMALPIVFTFILAGFPAGLVIYWCWNNVLSIAQQWVIMRRMGVPV